MMVSNGWRAVTVALVAVCGINGRSAAGAEPAAVDFERQVAPILIRHCAACHNPGDHVGELNLLDPQAALRRGESGELAIAAGNAAKSTLVARIEAGEMPPKGKGQPVSSKDLAVLKQWIDDGAKWPAGRVLSPFEFTTTTRAGRDWWSLKLPSRNQSQISDSKSSINPVDVFVIEKLAVADLSISPEADRATLIRRATLDLHGLPPTPEEVRAFVADPSLDAYKNLINRLLASPHYGERWGRHWLDVVRFAESAGFETNLKRANAWPYRDYVIESFNADKPFTQFIIEQLAGDQVGADVATSFLVAGPNDAVKSPDIELTRSQRLGELDDMVSTTSSAFLGLTTGCAKCHDHKFDPIAQTDYFALQAVFAGVKHGERDARSPVNNDDQKRRETLNGELLRAKQLLRAIEAISQPLARAGSSKLPTTLRQRVDAAVNLDRFDPVQAKYVRFTARRANVGEPCIDELEVFTTDATPRNVALASAGAKVTVSGVYANGSDPNHQLAHVNDGQYGNARSWISNENGKGWVQIELSEPATIDRVAWGRDREGRFKDRLAIDYLIEVAVTPNEWRVVASSDDRQPFDSPQPAIKFAVETLPEKTRAEYVTLQARIQSLADELETLKPQMAYAGGFQEPSEPTYRLHRGEPMQRREVIAPGTIAVLGNPPALDAKTPEAKRRLALANWIASEKNPLTARVLVNRIWHYHFGRGLMPSPNDFGFNGGQPSHPELLDWLACELMETGWRPKHIHRLIMLSQAYRQSSQANPQAVAVDGGNVLLWRFSPRRLEAEPIRDTMLAVAGTLDPTRGGPGFDVFEPNGNYVKVYTPKQAFGPAEWRRMIYMERPRMQYDSTFGVFDCPDFAQPVGKRNASTTALQALNLLNGPFVLQQSEKFAERLVRDAGTSVAAQVERAFWLAYGRPPDTAEKQAAESLVAAEGLPIFCRAILNSNELVFVR